MIMENELKALALNEIKNLSQLAPELPEPEESFSCKGDMIYLMGNPAESRENLDNAYLLQKALLTLQRMDLLESAVPAGSTSIFGALLRSCLRADLGFDITTDSEMEEKDFLFGELPLCYVVSVNDACDTEFIDYLFENNIPVMTMGHVTKGELRIDEESYGHILKIKAAARAERG